ncbi:MAG: rRNA processing protein RimM [Myxococcaceae bacterium]|nr:rRNA processing protein RimM [Myxococcaceae bacterium]
MPDSSPESELVELAAIVRAHALSGELVIKLFNPESELLSELDEVLLRAPSGEHRTYKVESFRGGGHNVLLRLAGVATRDQADALRGHVIMVDRAVFPPLEEGEYYLIDLPGLAVRNAEGAVIGHVDDVIEYPTVPSLVVVTDGIVREVPDLPRYLLEVRTDEGYVVVDHLDELEPVLLAPLKGKR